MSTGMKRRKFLKQAGKATAAMVGLPCFVPSSALGRDGNVAPSEKITIGCIGMGGMGRGDMRNFLQHQVAKVVGVCDVDVNHLNQAREEVDQKYGNHDCATYSDFREVIARKDIDALVLALPDQWHAIPAIMGAQAGKDIYAEKPLAYTIREGRSMVDAVEKYGIVWQTGSQQRSDARFRFACELVRNGRIGEVKNVTVGLPRWNSIRQGVSAKPEQIPAGFDYNMWLGPAPWAPYSPARCHWNFRWISDYSGGQITDWAGHHCDIAQWGMGTEETGPTEVQGYGKWPSDELFDTVEDYGFVCRFRQGFTMTVTGRFENGLRFEGRDGWIFVNRSRIEASPTSILESTIGANEIRLYRSNDHRGNFLDCIKSRRECVAPARIAQRSISIGHLGVIAIKLGRKLHWDPEKEMFIDDPEADRLLSRPMRSPWHLYV
jgi:predicted dehydrogenase